MSDVYTQDDPFIVSGGDMSEHVQDGIMAWTSGSPTDGGIIIRVGCQTWPIGHWKRHADRIVKNFIETDGDFDIEDVTLRDNDLEDIDDKIRKLDERGAIVAATKHIKAIIKEITPTPGNIKKAVDYTKKLRTAIEFIEKMVTPKTAAPARHR